MATLIAVDDDLDLLRLIRIALEKDGHRVLTFTNPEAVGEDDWAQADLILLDVMMPQQFGFELCQKIRGRLSCPILFLSARSEEEMMIEGLGYGADDYLTKPFSIDELLARLRAALRRSRADYGTAQQNTAVYHNGSLTIDYAAGCVHLDGEEIHLTPIEYKLLCVLARNTGKVLTHNYILKEVWGSALASDTPSLRVFMATLRKKIEKDPSAPRYIQTHIGVGYRMIRQ